METKSVGSQLLDFRDSFFAGNVGCLSQALELLATSGHLLSRAGFGEVVAIAAENRFVRDCEGHKIPVTGFNAVPADTYDEWGYRKWKITLAEAE